MFKVWTELNGYTRYFLIPKIYQKDRQKYFNSFRFFLFSHYPEIIRIYFIFLQFFNSFIIFPKSFKNYTENNVKK